jgi:hypothetical protein
MSVKRRLTGYSGMRFDWPHLRSLESGVSGDFDSVLRGLVTGIDRPYIMRGFNVTIPQTQTLATNLRISVADSSILHSTAAESGTILTIPADQADDILSTTATNISGAFVNGAANYVSLRLVRTTDLAAIDQTAGWSEPDQAQFLREVPTATILEYEYVISTAGFDTNLPLFVVGTNAAGLVEYITQGKTSLFRLGIGGTNPNPYHSYDFHNVTNEAQYPDMPRHEWESQDKSVIPSPVTVFTGDNPLAFNMGDFAIESLKEWMDAIMTRFKEVTGSELWYTGTKVVPNLADLWFDTLGSTLTGDGHMVFNQVLETIQPHSGKYQSPLDPHNTNDALLSSDVYLYSHVGINGRREATVTSYNNNQVLIHSLANDAFTTDDTVWMRRQWRPISAEWDLRDGTVDTSTGGDPISVNDGDNERLALLQRVPTVGGGTVITAAVAAGTTITIDAVAHGLVTGNYVHIEGLEDHDGTFQTVDIIVTDSGSAFDTAVARSVTLFDGDNNEHYFWFNTQATGFNPAQVDPALTGTGHEVQIVVGDSANAISTTLQGIVNGVAGFSAGVAVPTITVTNDVAGPVDQPSSTAEDALFVTVTNIPAGQGGPNGSYMVKDYTDDTFTYSAVIDPAAGLTLGATPTATLDARTQVHPYMPRWSLVNTAAGDPWTHDGTSVTVDIDNHPYTVGATVDIVVSGILTDTASDAENINGVFTATVNGDLTLTYVAHAAIVGGTTVLTGGELVRPDEYVMELNVEDADAELYNVEINNNAITIYDDVNIAYPMDKDAVTAIAGESGDLARQPEAGGAIQFDGVIAKMEIQPAVVIDNITVGAVPVDGTITVTTQAAHGLSNAVDVSFVIAGPITATDYVRTYEHMNIVVNSATEYELQPIAVIGTDITDLFPGILDYDNTIFNLDNVFTRIQGNPYAGPLQWTDDLVIKGLIGDLKFTIPQTATAVGTSDAPFANTYNQAGQTGTAYLANKHVAYIELIRNESVSSGSLFTYLAGGTITGPIALDVDGNVLEIGDYVKFEGEDDNKWLRINSIPIAGGFDIRTEEGNIPDLVTRRPANTAKLLYCKGSYPIVTVAPHYEVTQSPDIYWLGIRRDSDAPKAKIYMKALELEEGEFREVNDNEPSNLLIYTGAGNEANITPNYTQIDQTGDYQAEETLTVDVGDSSGGKDIMQRSITFTTWPTGGFSDGDTLYQETVDGYETWRITHKLSERTVIVEESVEDFVTGAVTYYQRNNFKIHDDDNLTLAIRKNNREIASHETALSRPVYDESVFPQELSLDSPGDDIPSGSWLSIVGTGTAENPEALAWVLWGGSVTTETIEGVLVEMPGNPEPADVPCIVHVYYDPSNLFEQGFPDPPPQLSVNGVPVGRFADGEPLKPAELTAGMELVLPPNRRTQRLGVGSIVKWGDMASYKASLEEHLRGEELMVAINDTIREAGQDYEETYGGPKAKIRLLTDLAPNSRIRFRNMAAYGSPLLRFGLGNSLQQGYDLGAAITVNTGRPVNIITSNGSVTGLQLNASVEIDGRGGVTLGGIFGPRPTAVTNEDQAFVIGRENNKPKEVWSGEEYVKSHALYAGSAWSRATASLSTAGAALTAIPDSAVTVALGETIRIVYTITARRPESGAPLTEAGATFRMEGTFYNLGAGAVLAGVPITTHIGSYNTTATPTFEPQTVMFGVAGNDIQLMVLPPTDGGVTHWIVGVDYQRVGSNV